MIETKVNDVITIGNKNYRVVEKDDECLGCAGASNDCLCRDLHNCYGMCSAYFRMDGKNIIYIEIK